MSLAQELADLDTTRKRLRRQAFKVLRALPTSTLDKICEMCQDDPLRFGRKLRHYAHELSDTRLAKALEAAEKLRLEVVTLTGKSLEEMR